MQTLNPYIISSDSSIRMTAHGIAVHLSAFLSGNKQELALTSAEINELVKALGHSLESSDYTAVVFDIGISAREILSELELSMAVDTNVQLIIKSDILNFIPSALTICDKETLEAAISFVWTIAIASRTEIAMNSNLQQVASPFLTQLSSQKSSFSRLAECALLSFQPDVHTG